ncbi:MAG: V-type ATP synthase beta chain, partial [Thermovirga lienii]
MPVAEYIGVKAINGPFVLVENVKGAGYGEIVEVIGPDEVTRKGRVVVLDERATLIQVFSGTEDLVPESSRVRFLGKELVMTLSPSILGRTFN